MVVIRHVLRRTVKPVVPAEDQGRVRRAHVPELRNRPPCGHRAGASRRHLCHVVSLPRVRPFVASRHSRPASARIVAPRRIVLDVRLPDPTGLQQSGLHLLRYLRGTVEHKHLPVLIFTGVPLSPSEEDLIRGNGGVFYKPQPCMVPINHSDGLLNSSAR
jgi:hypothetical protein